MKELYSEKQEIVLGALNEVWSDDQRYKESLSRQWQINANYANGLQFELDSRGFRAPDGRILTPTDQWENSLYVTDELASIRRTIVSYLTRSKPSVEIFGIQDDAHSYMKRPVIEQVQEAKYALDKEAMNSKLLAEWGFITGTGIRKDGWDHTFGLQAEVPEFDEFGDEVIDPNTGNVLVKKISGGRNESKIIPTFAISIDPGATSAEDMEFIIESGLVPIDWTKETYDKDEPGYTRQTDKVHETSKVGDSVDRLEELKLVTSTIQGMAKEVVKRKGKTLLRTVHLIPKESYPYGRMLVYAGDILLYDSPREEGSPYYMPYEPLMWHPYSFFIYEVFLGRFWGRSGVEGLIPIQRRINEINKCILKNANTIAQPNIMSAEQQIKRNTWRGGGSRNWEYKIIPGAPVPFIVQGTPLPAQFFNERQQLIEHMVRKAGTNFAMSGEAPKGITAAAAISQVLENANTQQSGTVLAFEDCHTQGFTRKLRLIRKYQSLPMNDVKDYLINITRGNTQVQRAAFTREDLSDGVGVMVQHGSMMAKSETVRRSTYLDLAQQGMLGPLQEDSPRGAELRSQLFEILGEKPLKSEDSIEVQKAKWENDRVLMGLPIQVGEFDVHLIHLSCHRNLFQDPHFIESASDEEKQALYAHLKEHQEIINQQQQAQMQAQMMAQGAPPAQPGPGMAPPQGMPPAGPPMPGADMAQGAPEMVV